MNTQSLLQYIALLSLFAMLTGFFKSVRNAPTSNAGSQSQNRAGMLVDVILASLFAAFYYSKIFSSAPAATSSKISGWLIAINSILQAVIFIPVFLRLYEWHKQRKMLLHSDTQLSAQTEPHRYVAAAELNDHTNVNTPQAATHPAPRIGFGNGLLCILLPPLLCFASLLLCQNLLYPLLKNYGLDLALQSTITMAKQASFEQQLGLCVATVIMAPLLEEAYFRGYLFRLLKQSYGLIAAMVVSGLIFAIIHNNLFALLPLWVFGTALAWSYQRSGRIIYPILAHALFNGISMYGIISGK